MRHALLTLLFIGVGLTSTAQQWWEPGACWINQSDMGAGVLQLARNHYDYDTLVDGLVAQVVHTDVQSIYPWGAVINVPQFTRLYRMDGNVVYSRCVGFSCPPTAVWDTTFYLGVPGDRWGLDNIDPDCYPLGAIEIQDTGHVVIQGFSLRTWDLAYLDEQGNPTPDQTSGSSDTLAQIERFGIFPTLPPDPCDGTIFEIFSANRIHYSDGDITYPEGTGCDLATSADAPHTRLVPTVSPNPGTTELLITGFSANASIEVRDPLGRLVHSQQNSPMNAPIETSAWESGTYFITVIQPNGTRDLLRWVKH